MRLWRQRGADPQPRMPFCAAMVIIAITTGCANLPSVPTETLIPVPVQCYDRMPDKPGFATDAELSAMPDYALVLSLAKERLTASVYIADLEAKLLGCVHPAPATSQP